jgi:four helix bundle protein
MASVRSCAARPYPFRPTLPRGKGAHTREFLHHLSIARGSLQELETVLLIAKHRAYMTPEQLEHLLELCDHVSRMISVIRRKLSN